MSTRNTIIFVIVFMNMISILNAENKWMKMKNDSLPLLYVENFNDGNANNWQPNYPQNWRVIKEDQKYIYQLTAAGQSGQIRKPTSISVLTLFDVGSFELTVSAKCYTNSDNPYRDLCLFFGYQDSVHFYYAHFSAKSDNVHNIIGIVNNADRTKINTEPPGTSLARLTGYDWHHLKISQNIETGEIKAYVDDFNTPILNATDTTFKHGKIGVGSFDDTGAFTDLTLWGNPVNQSEVNTNRSEVLPEYKLNQNYPNPFNSTTQIEFNLPNSSYVSLKVYNIIGQEVASLISAPLMMGKHCICWDASEISAGLYFYKLKADNYFDTKPMILLK